MTTTPLNTPTIHQLSNGLTIIAEQLPVEAVNLNVWFQVGSAVEPDPINGMAHFLEHMMFKGTPNLKPGDFDRLVEQRGGVMNAATSQDYTHYYITTAPKDFAELAPLQLELVSNPSLPEDEFIREKKVVLEEIRRSEDNTMRRTYARAMETCFESLPYRRPVLGPAEVISDVTPEQMREFHQQWYHPGTMTVSVVGNLPVETLIETVTGAWETIAPQCDPPSPKTVSFPEPEAPFREIVRRSYTDPQLQQARLVMLWRVPGLNDLQETYPLDVVAAILGQGKVSRLFRQLREEEKLVSAIAAGNSSQKLQGNFSISARLPEENLDKVETAIQDQIRRLQEEPISELDLNRIQTKIANRYIFANEKPSDRANLYGYFFSQLGDLQPAFNYPEIIRHLTPKDVQEAAQKYLSPEAYGIVTLSPPALTKKQAD
ncbi:peptidase M16 domain protein [Halothece sp. PCC 7418]|uniref:M16 family metallopeptidase n=1 Tax=Halothece sp. (strain PCC 7418) TaxID=65093 RepID=UPI0002A08744|nr:pitrilysin family protein [Halothece sp. PCC 7418]AFZ42340.1 peptidase M16 domain protein [Halothece sp. PCC 7418]